MKVVQFDVWKCASDMAKITMEAWQKEGLTVKEQDERLDRMDAALKKLEAKRRGVTEP